MLAFVPSSPSDYTYAPPVSSPLAPLSTNIYGTRPRHSNYMNAHEPDAKHTNSSSSKKASRYSENNAAPSSPSFLSSVPRSEASKPQPTNFSASITTPPTTSKLPFSQRSIKRNPLQQASSSSTLQTARRNNYLRKISAQRDDKRFESRGEDLMRLDFLSRQRAWEADRAREAEKAAWGEGILEEEEEAYEDEEYDLPVTSQMGASAWGSSGIGEEDEVEEFVRDEGRELEALLEIMPRDDDAMEEDGGGDETSLWSDDADYDELFEEMLLSQQNQEGMGHNVTGSAMLSSQAMPDMQQQQHDGGEDEMDMS
ncbi:hypothetical protein CB0940_05217 [Cercospora beticola]|uniref:Uncharacterized protein n=1 Tax=Cercospora beticola TaxID=122368 RepID=A0A2G5HMP1_CERBT|nr:hypothetical protein CB0940_05217 [Cercospora beticola]PIA93819.1 hypothetical protein CB0940_05217 [Cercospora beticola]WPB02534.1 hypothetical protein RHO25_007170 [Cercospora beticola]CAK1362572.1 unnamed protein product [Cercospora beticola]